jgi:hypothetical protein
MGVMYDSGLEAGWQPERDRWHAARQAAGHLPGYSVP